MENNAQYTPEYPMKWHKFLIYFSLWAGAFMNAVSGVGQVTGQVYQGYAGEVYGVFPHLKAIDLVFGAALLALAVYQIVTRFALAQYRVNAPGMLVAMYGIMAAVQVVYVAAVTISTGIWLADFSVILGIVSSVIFAFANRAYYQRRSELFVN